MNKSCRFCSKNKNVNKLLSNHCKCAIDKKVHSFGEHCENFEPYNFKLDILMYRNE